LILCSEDDGCRSGKTLIWFHKGISLLRSWIYCCRKIDITNLLIYRILKNLFVLGVYHNNVLSKWLALHKILWGLYWIKIIEVPIPHIIILWNHVFFSFILFSSKTKKPMTFL
jgi:hypothetical protein